MLLGFFLESQRESETLFSFLESSISFFNFCSLQKQVGKKNLPYFPPKKWVGNMKPKFVVKRRAELSSYLNKLDVQYLQLPCVKHFLSTGCETMEGEVGEGGGFDLEEAETTEIASSEPTGTSLETTTIDNSISIGTDLQTSVLDPTAPIGDDAGGEEEELGECIGPYYAMFDFTADSLKSCLLRKGIVFMFILLKMIILGFIVRKVKN